MISDPENKNQSAAEDLQSFGEIFSQYEKSHLHKSAAGQQLEGTVLSITAESVFFDIGYKSEGILPRAELRGENVTPGDRMPVTVKGRNPDGY